METPDSVSSLGQPCCSPGRPGWLDWAARTGQTTTSTTMILVSPGILSGRSPPLASATVQRHAAERRGAASSGPRRCKPSRPNSRRARRVRSGRGVSKAPLLQEVEAQMYPTIHWWSAVLARCTFSQLCRHVQRVAATWQGISTPWLGLRNIPETFKVTPLHC